jgi:hypothetical protein
MYDPDITSKTIAFSHSTHNDISYGIIYNTNYYVDFSLTVNNTVSDRRIDDFYITYIAYNAY